MTQAIAKIKLSETSPTSPQLCLRFRIDRLEHRSERQWTGGIGADAQFRTVSLGWFAVCGGLAFALGESPCDWKIGDSLELRRLDTGANK